MNNTNKMLIPSSTTLDKKQQLSVVIVTGLSGAGKSTTLRALEDLGFYCVDNLPVPLISEFLQLVTKTQPGLLKMAFGIDVRGGGFLNNFMTELEKIKESNLCKKVKILFLNASTQTLLKRFQETRRKHPLANGIDIITAIEEEKKLLEPIMDMSSIIVETNVFNIHELRNWIRTSFSTEEEKQLLYVNLISFGFKYGVPAESNMVYDLRFLPNPFFIPFLKIKNGTDKEIHDFLFAQEDVQFYWNKLKDFLLYSLQKSYEEGRFFATIAIGCTGGKHRSVCFVEKIAQQTWPHIAFITHHRDITKE